jgi:hypothetical protein
LLAALLSEQPQESTKILFYEYPKTETIIGPAIDRHYTNELIISKVHVGVIC